NDDVCWSALKKMPAGVQAAIAGSSSNAVVTYSIRPPAAGMTPIASLRNESSLVIAELKAIFDPSGDQTGPPSGPGCVTSGRTLPSATETTEMSAVPPLAFAGLTRWSKAIWVPSGDQLNDPTVNAPLVRRRAFCDPTSITHRWDMR